MTHSMAKQRWIAIGVLAAFGAIVTFTLVIGPFSYLSVCDQCGAQRHTKDWQLPMTPITFFSQSTVSDSSLSQVLLKNGIVQPHPHRWLFSSGGGNGVQCAIGPGRHIRPATDSKEFANLVLTLHMHGQTSFRDRVLHGAFDPKLSHLFRGLSFRAPKSVANDTELRDWIAEESKYLDEMVAVNKKR